ncbi:DUF983 domain-containing protein [Fretibacter rubidus]|uniref:DUF983 domain-containing protein n=1 Tax=Fretibacter rubidus TaxID=570162 RepID=UPI00352AF3E6
MSAVETGMRGRCPACGEGQLFKKFLTFHDFCEACGADFRIEDAGDGPAVFVIFITGIFIIPMALAFYLVTGLPMIVTILLFSVVIIVASLWLLRLMRGIMFSLQWVNKAREVRLSDVRKAAKIEKDSNEGPS